MAIFDADGNKVLSPQDVLEMDIVWQNKFTLGEKFPWKGEEFQLYQMFKDGIVLTRAGKTGAQKKRDASSSRGRSDSEPPGGKLEGS